MMRLKGKSLTPEQEEKLGQAERLHIRADVFVAGVAARLGSNDIMYAGRYQLEECARILYDASQMHAEAVRLQDGYRSTRPRTGRKRSARAKP